MNNLANFQTKSNADGNGSRRDLLDQTKLSRLPDRKRFSLPDFSFEEPATVAVCVGCDARLQTESGFQQSINCCRKCLGIYARLDGILNDYSESKADDTKRGATLAKMAGQLTFGGRI